MSSNGRKKNPLIKKNTLKKGNHYEKTYRDVCVY